MDSTHQSSLDVRVKPATLAKGKLVLRDSATFLILFVVTVALFSVTLLLFRSFEQRREDLGKEWSQRGKAALQSGHPDQAVAALRTALSYEVNERTDQLLLAQALAEAGHIEEATNYFLNLRDARPGDGFVNLQLARLARKQGIAPEAVNYYRASIFGNWEGDGAVRRREVRLELANYLEERGDRAAARAELLIAAGNAPEDAQDDTIFADRLQATGDLQDALVLYLKSLRSDPHDPQILAKAGRAAYSMGDYENASKLLSEADANASRGPLSEQDRKDIATLAANARRIPELSLSRDLPAIERADHLLLASEIAKNRLSTCAASLNQPPPASRSTNTTAQPPQPPAVLALQGRWASVQDQLRRSILEHDAALDDTLTQLIDDTERQTAGLCGPPQGDDALLLMLAARYRGPAWEGAS